MINFIGRRNYWFALSGIIIFIGVASLIYHRGLNFGIDFRGGNRVQLRLEKKAQTEKIRLILSRFGLGDAVIQPLGKDELIITTRFVSRKISQDMIASINKEVGVKDVLGSANVGPSFGKQLANQSLIALAVSLGAILLYIAFRFELNSAIAAIIALIHDILITIGVYAFLNREVNVSTVAALLTILGYSLYDTVVVFDRVRENSKKMTKGETFADMVNKSVNQTLTRSINTSLSALIPITALLVFGGNTLKDFALALFVGIASGAYSSIFIASPLLVVLKGMQAPARRKAAIQRPKERVAPKAIKRPKKVEGEEAVEEKEAAAGPIPRAKPRGKKPRKRKKR